MRSLVEHHQQPSASFATPPVIEVVLAVEFVPLPVGVLGALHLARIVDRWAGSEPDVEETVAAPPNTLEVVTGVGALPFSFGFGSPGVRFLVYTEHRSLLVQVQNDRLVLNWRRVHEHLLYPRFDFLREEFDRLWNDLCREVALREDALQPVIAEVTYVNEIHHAGRSEQPFAHLSAGAATVATLPTLRFQYQMPVQPAHMHGGGAVVVDAEPSGGEGHRMTVSTRLALHSTPGADRPVEALVSAHDVSVAEFVRATTDAYHREWGAEGL
ncbi:TIGR04255 family protein [Quadrisphaera granulorum]|uniref:Uncharacterized protein (TIGR04255 family) n=1 Tax=Quadrisphaera granulorum TaxID=317664 RepID=A0A316A7N9_9ACTN|nr:hypothetical protein [Quadrisphaera granulorum]PWJ52990.1 uncharacterized protein (TIGR04255 family) [Quadrisphaera granulorum]SZE97155.1 TIGR04255 family protein [Quadrisphaera granulorum]